jgi:hypothetical protein
VGQGGSGWGGVAREEKIGSFIWGQIKAGVWWLKWGKNMQLHLKKKKVFTDGILLYLVYKK